MNARRTHPAIIRFMFFPHDCFPIYKTANEASTSIERKSTGFTKSSKNENTEPEALMMQYGI